jgi:hypothetical protein
MSSAWQASQSFSNDKIEGLRAILRSRIPQDAMAVTFGSYARREASLESDIDYNVIGPPRQEDDGLMEGVERAVGGVVKIEPAAGGPFAKYVNREDMLKNLGGVNDTNETLTRRLLLLLEGEWIANEPQFKEFRRDLITKYVKATPRDHQICLFLLNDIIRYWRTMTVDYMYKTTEYRKPWAIRNIKLVFSRKLMYASGLFSIGMTVDKGMQAKIDILDELLSKPAIDRMITICGQDRFANALSSYEFFLDRMARPAVREALKKVAPGDHDNQIYRELKNEGHNFTRELLLAFENTFHSTHPIRRSIVF